MIPMQHSLTQGPITKNILLFALPLMFGNLLQQMYNIADTWVVGRFLGADALAARSEERRVGKECRSRWSPYH